MAVEQVIMAVVASVIYAMSVYLKRLPTDKAEAFEPAKLVATMIVGVLVGFLANGVVPDEATVESQLMLYAGLVMVVQNGITMVYRYIVKYIPL